ncbi:hypothetical protein D3C72_535100 [compost metagenome]
MSIAILKYSNHRRRCGKGVQSGKQQRQEQEEEPGRAQRVLEGGQAPSPDQHASRGVGWAGVALGRRRRDRLDADGPPVLMTRGGRLGQGIACRAPGRVRPSCDMNCRSISPTMSYTRRRPRSLQQEARGRAAHHRGHPTPPWGGARHWYACTCLTVPGIVELKTNQQGQTAGATVRHSYSLGSDSWREC